MNPETTTHEATKPTLADQLAYILEHTGPDSQWRRTVEYKIEATYELVKEDRADFGGFI